MLSYHPVKLACNVVVPLRINCCGRTKPLKPKTKSAEAFEKDSALAANATNTVVSFDFMTIPTVALRQPYGGGVRKAKSRG